MSLGCRSRNVSLKDRLCEVTWGWYSITMATGGIPVLLYNTPHQFAGLNTIGKIIYIYNLVLFVLISACLALRFSTNAGALKASFQSPTETYFVATCVLSIATIILGAASYGTKACGPWLLVALRIIFWIYVAISVLEAIVHTWYLYHAQMGSHQPFAIARFLPFFPAMLCGTIASVLASDQPRTHAVTIIIGGTTLQGFGFVMALFIYAEYTYKLHKHGLPNPAQRPQMFIAVGPWSFTAIALIGMANAAVQKLPPRYIISSSSSADPSNTAPTTGEIALILASLVAIFLWTIAFFHLCIAFLSVVSAARFFGGPGVPGISLPYWSMVFPNTGFVIATIRIGEVLQSPAVLWVCSVLTVLQVAVWLVVSFATGWAVLRRRMLWPEEGKEKEEENESGEDGRIFPSGVLY